MTDASGHEVENLTKDDFVAKLGEEQLPILFEEYQSSGPASVLILADTSGSSQAKLPQTREAIAQVVKNLDPRDDVVLSAFSSRPFLLQSFTRERSVIIERAVMLHAYGSTSLFDGVHTSIAMLRRGCYARRVMVVISDGIDNTSAVGLDSVAHELRTSGVSAYAIAIGNVDANVNSGMHFGPIMTGQTDDAISVNEKSLGMLTNPSGGATFKVSEVGDRDLLAAAVKSIVEGSRGQYVLGFIDPWIDPALVTIQIKNHEEYLMTRAKTPPTAAASAPAPTATPIPSSRS